MQTMSKNHIQSLECSIRPVWEFHSLSEHRRLNASSLVIAFGIFGRPQDSKSNLTVTKFVTANENRWLSCGGRRDFFGTGIPYEICGDGKSFPTTWDVMGKYGTLTNRGIFCCQIKFPTFMEHYQWMMFYVCWNSISMNFNHRTINESKSYVFFRQKYLANIGEGSFPAE